MLSGSNTRAMIPAYMCRWVGVCAPSPPPLYPRRDYVFRRGFRWLDPALGQGPASTPATRVRACCTALCPLLFVALPAATHTSGDCARWIVCVHCLRSRAQAGATRRMIGDSAPAPAPTPYLNPPFPTHLDAPLPCPDVPIGFGESTALSCSVTLTRAELSTVACQWLVSSPSPKPPVWFCSTSIVPSSQPSTTSTPCAHPGLCVVLAWVTFWIPGSV